MFLQFFKIVISYGGTEQHLWKLYRTTINFKENDYHRNDFYRLRLFGFWLYSTTAITERNPAPSTII